MGLIFDRIHFPHVHLPTHGYNESLLHKEIERIEALRLRDYDTALLLAIMKFLPLAKILKGVCYFDSENDKVDVPLEEGTEDLVVKLYEQIYGPPKEGFIPTFNTDYSKQLPESEEYIGYPGIFHYPSNALIYSARRGIPLINDNPNLPVLALRGESAKNNAKLLSATIAIECIKFVLPKIRPLTPGELVEIRDEVAEHTSHFRVALLRFAGELNKAILSSATAEEIGQAARFLVETNVYPQLLELKSFVNQPSRPWYSRAYDIVKKVPELTAGFLTLPTNIALANLLSAITGILVDVDNDRKNKAKTIKRSGLYYEETNDILAAIGREKQIKGWLRAKKVVLIESINPTWQDLSEDWL